MKPFDSIRSHTAVLPRTDVDTDQIIPARFLTTTTREGLGESLFADWRYAPDGQPNPEFELNQPVHQGALVLVAGRNFGCGSSREHAPWSLVDYGFRVVISTEIADIFRSNSLKNGLLPIVVPDAIAQALLKGSCQVEIDLQSQHLRFDSATGPIEFHFEIDGFAKHCLLNGIDQLGFLLEQKPAIEAFEKTAHGTSTI